MSSTPIPYWTSASTLVDRRSSWLAPVCYSYRFQNTPAPGLVHMAWEGLGIFEFLKEGRKKKRTLSPSQVIAFVSSLCQSRSLATASLGISAVPNLLLFALLAADQKAIPDDHIAISVFPAASLAHNGLITFVALSSGEASRMPWPSSDPTELLWYFHVSIFLFQGRILSPFLSIFPVPRI